MTARVAHDAVPDAPVVRVLVADAGALQRAGWRAVIDSQPDLRVVAEAADGVQALRVLRRTPVDVAVVSALLPKRSGPALAAIVRDDNRVRLVQRPPVTRLLLMAAVDLDRVAIAPGASAADAVLWTGADPEELLAAIRAAAVRRR